GFAPNRGAVDRLLLPGLGRGCGMRVATDGRPTSGRAWGSVSGGVAGRGLAAGAAIAADAIMVAASPIATAPDRPAAPFVRITSNQPVLALVHLIRPSRSPKSEYAVDDNRPRGSPPIIIPRQNSGKTPF
ncbi:MAG: hypothetical protein AB7O50_12010, partial [Pseudolabrys sp.]